MTTPLPPLPEPVDVAPFNHMRVYAFTEDQMRAYGQACAIAATHGSQRGFQDEAYASGVAAERERIKAVLCTMHADAEGRHNYYLCAVVELFGVPDIP